MMQESLKKVNQVLAKDQAARDREALVLYIVNLNTPYEGWGGDKPEAWSSEEHHEFTKRLREATERYWPELWKAPNERDSGLTVEDRAWEVIRTLREYLRQFWRADNEDDRDWHIYRAREWWYSRDILPELLQVDEPIRFIKQKFLLDKPPQRHSQITKALYELQRRARKPSTAPRVCPNDCENRYFLSSKKGQVYCPDCRRTQPARNRASKRKWHHANKDKRRNKRG